MSDFAALYPTYKLQTMMTEHQCERCGRRYPEDATVCVYCRDLTDADIQDINKSVDDIKRRNKGLGLIFLYLIGIFLLVVVSLLLL